MQIRGLLDIDTVNYKKLSMFIAFPDCSLKCGKELCQNSSLLQEPIIEITKEELCERYLNTPLSSAIVCGGLEPFDSTMELCSFIDCLRRQYNCDDDVVIYTGYTKEELEQGIRYPETGGKDFLISSWEILKSYKNIIVKFGRYIPNEKSHYDSLLGVYLSSPNQYAERIEKEDKTMRIYRMPNSESILKAVKDNDGYCPCKLEKTKDTKCICKEFREQKEGECHCGLYYKEM